MMSNLPIHAILPELLEKLPQVENLVLQAEPGAGKSTVVPLALLQSDWFNRPENRQKKIIMLEPRRLAVRALARFLSSKLGEVVGQQIGYQLRNERKVSKNTRLEIVTEGILTRRLQSDPELKEVALIIFDEFHERSLQADLALTLCRDVQESLREDLKLLVMSATLDRQAVAEYLGGAETLFCQGRSFPVETTYAAKSLPVNAHFKWDVLPVLLQTIKQALLKSQQDILVFLPGQREIHQTFDSLLSENSTILNKQEVELHCLYGGLTPKEQDLALKKSALGRRKIVLSTNIAETSLTIEGLDCVVDVGLARHSQFDVNSGMTRLDTQRISQASAEQRKGRAGRLQAGLCFRLWTQSQQQQMRAYDQEEILSSDLSDLSLELALWGVTHPNQLAWLTPPPEAHFQQAKQLLQRLGLLNDKGQLSEFGKQSVSFGASPRITNMLLQARAVLNDNELQQACQVAALLSERDVLRNAAEIGADMGHRLLALQAYMSHRKQAKQAYQIVDSAMEQVLQLSRKWQAQLGVYSTHKTDDGTAHKIADKPAGLERPTDNQLGMWLAWAFPDRIAMQRSAAHNAYQLANGKGAKLRDTDSMSTHSWLVVANLDGQQRDGTIFLAAPYSQSLLREQYPEDLVEQSLYRFQRDKQRFEGVTQIYFDKLLLEEKPLSQLDEEALHACMLQEIRRSRFKVLHWSKSVIAWLGRVRWLASTQESESSYQGFDEEALLASLEEWLRPYLAGLTNLQDLKNLDYIAIFESHLGYESSQALQQQAPDSYVTPTGRKVPIEYALGKNPTVSVVLQEVFGELSSPLLAFGQMALTFELLSPARRPIQTTADLAQFWQSSYYEIAKEMRGRYPKHRWPEKPLEEQPGHSLKSRS